MAIRFISGIVRVDSLGYLFEKPLQFRRGFESLSLGGTFPNSGLGFLGLRPSFRSGRTRLLRALSCSASRSAIFAFHSSSSA